MSLFEENTAIAVPAAGAPVISVSELNRLVRAAIEHNLPLTWVSGEISNMRRYDSGHWYFTLKDAAAQVDCVMFRHKAQHMDWQPADGMKVEVRALATVYEARGKYQLNIEAMRRAGLGALYEAYERLKARLEAEGLFAEERKREIPAFPRAIGVVTSPQAAALRDVLTTLKRRMPSIPVVIYPAPVQGEGAAAKIMQAIATASTRAARDQCDVLIVCRGGGSIEDLWSFNEEVVARAIHACAIPVVSGVGHETDFTIADFVADARAPTPTAAAELVSPDRAELRAKVAQTSAQLMRVTRRALEDHMQKLDYLQRRLTHPGERIAERQRHLAHLAARMSGAWKRETQDKNWSVRSTTQRMRAARPDLRVSRREVQEMLRRLRDAKHRRLALAESQMAGTGARLSNLDPQRVLERGYSITQNAAGDIVRESERLAINENVRITFASGWAAAEIKSKV
ncbi:MAG TPA: exodeoxyribonuclease VII large subunit [Burkholderiales bacterium]|nr:exodeoxyribonuclease VII large subunit [Burkholderiales bacterium]